MSEPKNPEELVFEETLDQVHEAIKAVYLRLGQASFPALEAELKDIAARFSSVLEKDPTLWLQVRRTLAETTLVVAIEKRCAVSRCEALLGALEALGWEDLHRKGLTQAAFCNYCARRKKKEIGLRLLLPLMVELETELACTGDPLWANHLRACEGIRERLEQLV